MELVFLFLLSFGSVIVVFAFYLGYFKPVKFKTQKLPTLSMAVRPYIGDYKNAAAAQVSLMQELQAAGLSVDSTVGIYFDNPKRVDSKALRSLVGVVISDEETLIRSGVAASYIRLEADDAFHTSWVYKSGLSIMVAIMKVNPAFAKRAKRQGFEVLQSIEYYDFNNKVLHFYFPKQSLESLWEMHK